MYLIQGGYAFDAAKAIDTNSVDAIFYERMAHEVWQSQGGARRLTFKNVEVAEWNQLQAACKSAFDHETPWALFKNAAITKQVASPTPNHRDVEVNFGEGTYTVA